MVKKWSMYGRGDRVEAIQRINGAWVTSYDYLLLREALKEALDAWEGFGKAYCCNPDWVGWTRISQLRSQFLDGKD